MPLWQPYFPVQIWQSFLYLDGYKIFAGINVPFCAFEHVGKKICNNVQRGTKKTFVCDRRKVVEIKMELKSKDFVRGKKMKKRWRDRTESFPTGEIWRNKKRGWRKNGWWYVMMGSLSLSLSHTHTQISFSLSLTLSFFLKYSMSNSLSLTHTALATYY